MHSIGRAAPTTFLGALRRDVRGNTLAIMAAALFPLIGLIGGGVDIARMYMTKTRLQHACDAGALGGRKAMGGGTWSQSSYYPRTIANQFFTGNFGTGSYSSYDLIANFTENAGKVTGAVSVKLPMTLMQVFGIDDQTIAVDCDAEMKLPNTDVMFVLDTTGSMGYNAPGGGGTKLDVLQSAVKCFYETVARLNTTENCPNGNPSGGVTSDIQVRFGFVPFATNVNVGRLLPSDWFADQWNYQTREKAWIWGKAVSWNNDRNVSGWSGWTNTGRTVATSNSCSSAMTVTTDSLTKNGEASWPDEDSQYSSTASAKPTNWTAWVPYLEKDYQLQKTNGICYEQVKTRTLEKNYDWNGENVTETTADAVRFPAWAYKQMSLDIRGLKSGSGWNSGLTLPIGNNHTDQYISWEGCIEERQTAKQANYEPIPSGAKDLDIDLAATNDATRWGPLLPAVLHARQSSAWSSGWGKYRFRDTDGAMTMTPMTTFTQRYDSNGDIQNACAAPAKKMAVWNNATTFENYVDSLRASGNTYHDIGLLWGARLISPSGLFKSENEKTPRGGDIQRNLIFMTDGDACTNPMNYQAYGLSWYDRRTIDANNAPPTGQSCSHESNRTELTKQIDARTTALCTAVKNKGIALWVVYFPDQGAVYTDVENRLKACADSGRYYVARNSTALKSAFADIAAQISQLRLTN